MDRFFISKEQITSEYAYITGGDVRHIRRVLRKEVGDKIELVSDGRIYKGEIIEIEDDRIDLKILKKKLGNNEPKLKITLYQGLAKGNRMDYVLQKATEIGVTEFYIVDMERSVVKLNSDKKRNSRLVRWQKIVDEAAKQSKRDYIPKVKDIINFDMAISSLKKEKNIIVPYEEEENLRLSDIIDDIEGESINILIGPEGGISKEEIEKIKKIKGKSISLGPRILRTETAGIVLSTLLLYEFGDI